MKKIISVLLCVLFIFSVSGCGSNENSNGQNAAQGTPSDPVEPYVGAYLLIDIKQEGNNEDYKEFLQSEWEERNFFQYCVITPEKEFSFYENGSEYPSLSCMFDPETLTLYFAENEDDKLPLEFDGDMFSMQSNGTTLFFQMNQELANYISEK